MLYIRFRVKPSPSVAVPSNLSGDCNSLAAGIDNFAFRDLQFDLWTQLRDLLLLLTLIFGLILFYLASRSHKTPGYLQNIPCLFWTGLTLEFACGFRLYCV